MVVIALLTDDLPPKSLKRSHAYMISDQKIKLLENVSLIIKMYLLIAELRVSYSPAID